MEANHRKRWKAKLERRNAMKNFDFQVPTTTSASLNDDVASLDLLHQTSFRVKGVDGEFDLLFRSLGLSGPEDFEIPTADWEAREARSTLSKNHPLGKKVRDEIQISAEFQGGVGINSDIELKGENSQRGENRKIDKIQISAKFEIGVGNNSDTKLKGENFRPGDEGKDRNIDVSSSNSKTLGFSKDNGMLLSKVGNEISAKFESGVGISSDIELKGENFQPGEDREIDVSSSNSKALGSNKDGGGGIKGVRPPVLLPPPAAMVRPIVDDVSSTWDLVSSFAPQDDRVIDSPIQDRGISSSGEDEEMALEGNEEVVDGDINGGEELHGVGHGESNVLSDSGSSASHDDDDNDGGDDKATAVVDESVYNVSPNGSLRRTFSSWQKGEILGKGSFGTVYEGFTR